VSRPGLATFLTIAVIGLFRGLNWPAIKFLLTEVPPFTIRVYAFTVATVALAIWTAALGQSLIPPLRELPWMTLTGLLTIFAFNMLTTLGQILTETSKAAIIAYTMPALTAVFSVVFLGERLRRPVILAVVIGLGGIAVLASENLGHLIANPLGPAIMLGSATVWALGTVAMKAGRFTLQPLALTTWFMGLSALACWPFALALEQPLSMPVPSAGALAVWLWHALLPMVVNYALWTGLVSRASEAGFVRVELYPSEESEPLLEAAARRAGLPAAFPEWRCGTPPPGPIVSWRVPLVSDGHFTGTLILARGVVEDGQVGELASAIERDVARRLRTLLREAAQPTPETAPRALDQLAAR